MGTFLLFASVFLVFGWFTYRMIRYTRDSVGTDSPLERAVVYRYSEWDFLSWRQTPLIVSISLFLVWIFWVLLANLNTATSPWQYVIVFSMLALCAGYFYLLNKLFLLEEQLWTIIRDTSLTLDPAMQSITVHRSGTSTVLTASTVALIESHITGRSTYHHFRFVDHTGRDTFFYDYGKGLGFAIEAYFKAVPMKWVEHKFPFNTVPVA